MVEVIKVVVTSFKRSCARSAALSVPDPTAATADPCLCQRLLDTRGQVWGSFLLGHCSFALGPGAHKVLFVPSKSLFPQSCVSSGSSMVGLIVNSSKGLRPYPGLLHPEPLPLRQTTADPYLHRRHSNTILS